MVSDCKTFANKGCKIATQIYVVFFSANFSFLAGFFGIVVTIGIDSLSDPYAGFFLLSVSMIY